MNILPVDSARWQLSKCTMSGLNFTMQAGGAASVALSTAEILKLSDKFELSCIVSPNPDGYTPSITCTVTVQYKDLSVQRATLVLSNNKNTYCFIPFELTTSDVLLFNVTFNAAIGCNITSTSIASNVVDNSAVIEELKSEMPKLLDDYNMQPIVVGQSEVTVGLITANLIKDTDLNAHFSCTGWADDESFVFVRFYDDQVKCLFAPIVSHVMPGRFNISVPCAYLKSTEGFHNFYVTMQGTRGNLNISTRGVLYTIDGSHLATRLVDAPASIEDMTASMDATSIVPKKVFIAELNGTTATFRSAPFTDGTTFSWAVDKSLQDVKAVAVECNGVWVATSEGRRFQTEDTPKVCFVDMNGNLYIAPYDLSRTTLLAPNVAMVSALRGWKYVDSFVDNDTGFLVAYIKEDGKAYYRHFTVSRTLPDVWQPEVELSFADAVTPFKHISTLRTNDYRIAISIQDANDNCYTYLSKRYYQSDSVPSINISSKYVLSTNLTEPIYPVITGVSNISNTRVVVTFSHPVELPLEGLQQLFSLTDANNVKYTVHKTEPIFDSDGKVRSMLLHTTTFAGVLNSTLFVYTSGNSNDMVGPIRVLHNGSMFTVPSYSCNFDAVDMTPKFYINEHIAASVKLTNTLIPLSTTTLAFYENIAALPNLSLTLTNVKYTTVIPVEHISATCILISVLTQVGTEPI